MSETLQVVGGRVVIHHVTEVRYDRTFVAIQVIELQLIDGILMSPQNLMITGNDSECEKIADREFLTSVKYSY